ncbi:DUF4397 domain-containing protein [Jatrophihabitans endophyticus]|uniref:DUF4397 domain-containing protein n=1 Tax=Jatrophihabitans endophyticus TaxID=1206085 RepID=UPI000932B924|nr:DUF4397 domain-containing protein [Jatrophihabitans endophyticus]
MVAAGAVPLATVVVASGTAPSAAAAAPAADATIRAAHFSPTTPGVDVYLGRFDGRRPPTTLWLSHVRYGAVTAYQPLTPGVYTVAMRAAGASPTSPPMLTWTLHARPHDAYTVAGVGAGTAVRGVVVRDDLSTPPAGRGRVRVVQAASRVPVADVEATDGQVISRSARFATVTGYATLPAGRWTVRARGTSGSTASASGPVVVRSGQVTSILLLDAKTTGITVRTVLDAASAGVVPRDAVPAGAGGTARLGAGGPAATLGPLAGVLGGLAVLLAAASAGTWRRRRRCSPGRTGRDRGAGRGA